MHITLTTHELDLIGLRLTEALSPVFSEILKECLRRDEQDYPMFGDPEKIKVPTKQVIQTTLDACRGQAKASPNWFSILLAEFSEAFLETDPAKQREEMVQAAAVAVQIIEYLDRRIER
jgi:hypothetical protein